MRSILLFSAAVQSLGIDIHLRGSEEPLLAGAELRVSGDGIDHVAQGFNAAKLILSTSTEARTIASTTCGVEATATEKWISGGLGEDKDAAAARAASKAAMHGALGNRLAGLLKFLKRLKKIRARLYDHIVRVNDVSSTHPTNPKTWALPCKVVEMHDANGTGGSFLLWWFVFFGIGFLLFNRQLTIHTLDPPLLTIFIICFFISQIYGSKFKENMNYMNGAVQSLHALSVILTTPISPKLRPIKNFLAYEPPSAEASAASAEIKEVEADAGETSLIELEQAWDAQSLRFSTMHAKEDECCSSHNCPCSKGRQQAFELYEKALALNAKMSVNFEAERKVLAAFRKGLKKMIESREANLAALQAQLSKLESSMNATEEPIQGLFKKMEVHLDVLKGACAQQSENAKVDVVEINKLVSLIQEHHVGTPEGAGEATGAEDETAGALVQ